MGRLRSRARPELTPRQREAEGVHARGEVEQHRGLEALTLCVGRGGPHAVVGGDAHDVHLLDRPVAQPVREADLSVRVVRDIFSTDFEKALIESTLEAAGGVQKRAAELLHIKPTTLNEMIQDIARPASASVKTRWLLRTTTSSRADSPSGVSPACLA